MLWRVRTTLPDRPGAVAVLALRCGDAGVNILGLQIFPGIEAVTDELALRTPAGWGPPELAAQAILARPASFPEIVAMLFDAEAEPGGGASAVPDVREMTVGDVQVQVRRLAPFTATEHVRGSALAELVTDVLDRGRVGVLASTPDYVVDGDSVSAVVDGRPVGLAVVRPVGEEAGVRSVTLRVDPAWQRRGIAPGSWSTPRGSPTPSA